MIYRAQVRINRETWVADCTEGNGNGFISCMDYDDREWDTILPQSESIREHCIWVKVEVEVPDD